MIHAGIKLLGVITAFMFVTGCVKEQPVTTFPSLNEQNLQSNKIIAVYGKEQITGAEFSEFLAVQGFLNPDAPVNDKRYRKDSLYRFIMERSCADKMSSTKWVEDQTNALWKQVEQAYNQSTRKRAYQTLQIDEEAVKKHIKRYFLTEQYFSEQLTTKELLDYYQKNKNEYTNVSFQQLVVSASEKELEDVESMVKSLQQGKSLQEVKKQYSPFIKFEQENQFVQNAPLTSLPDEVEDSLTNQQMGTIIGPIKAENRYYIITLKDKDAKSFESVKDKIAAKMIKMKMSHYIQDELQTQVKKIDVS
ncbi:hypothetical protein FZC66_05365 [Priestia megaterium]|nr:hypothetical protein FZC66_05365 [Priestia megaterium]